MPLKNPLVVSEEIRAALAGGRPVVALESAVLTHGLPYPHNVAAAMACEDAVREAGAVPATIAVLDGRVRVGLLREELERLGAAGAALIKCGARDLGAATARGLSGGATVSATLALAALAGIAFLSTGGIGGVHRGRGGAASADISADLPQLARSAVTVVSSGAKAILDLPRTLEYLETMGVPVLGYGTNECPAFVSRESGLRLTHRVDTPEEAARVVEAYRALNYGGAILIANPPPAAVALQRATVEQAVEAALARSTIEQMQGPEVTPFLLAQLVQATAGQSLAVNLALLPDNARVAAEIAVRYFRPEGSH